MADGIYKNGVAIEVSYQAVNSATGKTVTMDVYDASHALDAGKSIAAMTEVGSTGRYYASFTPDTEGNWIVLMENTTDSNGKVIKAFAVVAHNIDSLGDDIAALQDISTTQVGSEVDSSLATYDAPTKAELDTAESNIRGADSDTLKTISDQVDGIGSPAMVG